MLLQGLIEVNFMNVSVSSANSESLTVTAVTTTVGATIANDGRYDFSTAADAIYRHGSAHSDTNADISFDESI